MRLCPGFESISPDFNKRKFLMYQLILVRNYIIGEPIGDVMKEYLLTFLTGHLKDTKEILFYFVCLISC